MSNLAQPAAASGPWAQLTGAAATGVPTNTGPVSIGAPAGFPRPLPTVNSTNLPTTTPGLPPIGLGTNNTPNSNIYDTATISPPSNPFGMGPRFGPPMTVPTPPAPPPIDPNYQRRLTKLEDENAQRRTAIIDVQRLGTQIMQGQIDVQEQVLEYQYMLEQCMEALDSQNQLFNEQAEELAMLRSKMRHIEYLMDALKMSTEGSQLMRSISGEVPSMDGRGLCCGEPLSIPTPSTSRFSAGGPTRITSSTFQPFNPRYRSPNSRAATAAALDARRSPAPKPSPEKGPKPGTNYQNLFRSNERPSRRFSNTTTN